MPKVGVGTIGLKVNVFIPLMVWSEDKSTHEASPQFESVVSKSVGLLIRRYVLGVPLPASTT